jgi:arylsulfatase A-like enzyme
VHALAGRADDRPLSPSLRPSDRGHPLEQQVRLATDERLLPQALQETGYETAIVGKWHLGHADRKYWPRQRGFDYQYGALLGEIDYFTHSAHGTTDWFRNNQEVKEEGYVTELIGQDAVRVIEKHDPARPLFLYLTFTARTRPTRRRRPRSTSTRTSRTPAAARTPR